MVFVVLGILELSPASRGKDNQFKLYRKHFFHFF